MTKRLKKLVCAACAAMCVAGTTVPAYAETITFNVTPPNDSFSRTAKKADSEQAFYVTGTYFSSSSGRLTCYSQKITNNSVRSYSTTISSSNPAKSASYMRYAAAGAEYEMYTTASISGMNVQGRYTP